MSDTLTLYAVADIHGKADRLTTLTEVIRRFNPDLLLMAGDLTQYFKSSPTLEAVSKLDLPILGIQGNSDLKSSMEKLNQFHGFTWLTPQGFQWNDICFRGINGTIPLPFASRVGLRDGALIQTIPETHSSPTVLMAHPPARGILDRVGGKFSAGSRELARLIRKTHPMLFICGHIHEQNGWAIIDQTLVVNCAMGPEHAGTLIQIKKNTPISIRPLKHTDGGGNEIRLTL